MFQKLNRNFKIKSINTPFFFFFTEYATLRKKDSSDPGITFPSQRIGRFIK